MRVDLHSEHWIKLMATALRSIRMRADEWMGKSDWNNSRHGKVLGTGQLIGRNSHSDPFSTRRRANLSCESIMWTLSCTGTSNTGVSGRLCGKSLWKFYLSHKSHGESAQRSPVEIKGRSRRRVFMASVGFCLRYSVHIKLPEFSE